MVPPVIGSRAVSRPRSAERLDRDRQAAPQVFERLRGMIISLELPPGSPLSRAALASQFGRQLDADPRRAYAARGGRTGRGLPAIRHRRQPDRRRLAQQAHFLRQAVELEIVGAARAATGRGPRRQLNPTIALPAAVRQGPATSRNSWPPTTSSMRSFMRRPTSQDLWTLVTAAAAGISTGCAGCICPRPGKAQDIVRHHKLIAPAIAAGEPDEAQRHLRTHLSGTLSELAEIRARYPEYPQRLTAGIAVDSATSGNHVCTS